MKRVNIAFNGFDLGSFSKMEYILGVYKYVFFNFKILLQMRSSKYLTPPYRLCINVIIYFQSWYLVSIVGLIGTGLVMFTYKSTQFNALGFFFILFASLSSGLRWSFAQFIMQKSKLGLHNPIDMIYYMQPWMIASLVPLVFGIEGKFGLLQVLSGLKISPILLQVLTLSRFLKIFIAIHPMR